MIIRPSSVPVDWVKSISCIGHSTTPAALRMPYAIPSRFNYSNICISRNGQVWLRLSEHRYRILSHCEEKHTGRVFVIPDAKQPNIKLFVDELILSTFGCKTQQGRYAKFKQPVIRHRDGKLFNNALSNLEWVEYVPEDPVETGTARSRVCEFLTEIHNRRNSRKAESPIDPMKKVHLRQFRKRHALDKHDIEAERRRTLGNSYALIIDF